MDTAAKYSKLIAAVVGVLFSAGAVWGFADSTGHILGMDQATALTVITPIVTGLITWLAPANKTT